MVQLAINAMAWFAGLVLPLYAVSAQAATPSATLLNSQEVLSFHLGGQSLSQALAHFSRQAGLSVLLDSSYAHLPAPALQGEYTRKQALAGLLAGTGLLAYFVDNRSIVVRSPQSLTEASKGVRPLSLRQISGVHQAGQDFSAYVAQVQHAVLVSLCQAPLTRPGVYRLAMQIWVNHRGTISRINFLGTTQHAQRDQAIYESLQGLPVGRAPDDQMPQPIVVLLAPASAKISAHCPARANR